MVDGQLERSNRGHFDEWREDVTASGYCRGICLVGNFISNRKTLFAQVEIAAIRGITWPDPLSDLMGRWSCKWCGTFSSNNAVERFGLRLKRPVIVGCDCVTFFFPCSWTRVALGVSPPVVGRQ